MNGQTRRGTRGCQKNKPLNYCHGMRDPQQQVDVEYNETGRKPNLPSLRVIEPVNELFVAADDPQSYRLLKKPSLYDENAAHELHKMSKKIAVQMKKCTLRGKTRCRWSPSSSTSNGHAIHAEFMKCCNVDV